MDGSGFSDGSGFDTSGFPDVSSLEQRMDERSGAPEQSADVGDSAATQDAAGDVSPPTEAPTPASEEVFYDASKVPPELQATFREMQAAWTKKTQEIAPLRKLADQVGGVEPLVAAVEQLSSPEGVLEFWFDVAERLGLSRDQLGALLDGEEVSAPQRQMPQQEEYGADLDRPMTVREYEQMRREEQARQQQEARIQQEDQEVESTLRQLKVPAEAEDFVIAAAYRQPKHLGYAERIRRGFEQYQKALDAHAAEAAKKVGQIRENTPKPLGGSPAVQGHKPARNLDEARARAEERLSRLATAE